MKKSLAAVVLASLASTALAGAALVETQVSKGGDQYDSYYSVQFAAEGSDIGLPGGYFYGIVRNEAEAFFLGRNGGWQQYKSGMLEGLEYLPSMPSQPRSYHPLTGVPVSLVPSSPYGWNNSPERPGATRQEICAKAGLTRIDFYAGIGALTPDKEALVVNFHSVKNPRISLDHIRDSYLQTDMNQRGKVQKIASFDCTPERP